MRLALQGKATCLDVSSLYAGTKVQHFMSIKYEGSCKRCILTIVNLGPCDYKNIFDYSTCGGHIIFPPRRIISPRSCSEGETDTAF